MWLGFTACMPCMLSSHVLIFPFFGVAFSLFLAPLFLYFQRAPLFFGIALIHSKNSLIFPKIGLHEHAPNTNIVTRPE
jgi:hypothetical protein